MALFISDKGREFNRSFRQSMIEGKIIDKDGSRKEIPEKLRNALAVSYTHLTLPTKA